MKVTESSALEERHFPGRACGLDKPGPWSKYGEAGAVPQVPVSWEGPCGWFCCVLTNMVVLFLDPATTPPPHCHTLLFLGPWVMPASRVAAVLRSLAALSVAQLYHPGLESVTLYLPPSRAGIMGLWLEGVGECCLGL